MKKPYVLGGCRPHPASVILLLSLAAFGSGPSLMAQSAGLADLIVNRQRLASSIDFRTHNFSASDCAVVEGCVKGTGARKLLRFDAGLANIGAADLVIGRPEDNPGHFVYSDCHGHYHLKGAATYQLCRPDGQQVLTESKQSFCMRDNVKYLDSAGPSKGFTCDYQGITAGWEDVYYKGLDCQWLDVTGIPSGNYLLKVIVNPEKRIEESNYGNNTASVPVTINGNGNGTCPKCKPKYKCPKHKKKPHHGKGGDDDDDGKGHGGDDDDDGGGKGHDDDDDDGKGHDDDDDDGKGHGDDDDDDGHGKKGNGHHNGKDHDYGKGGHDHDKGKDKDKGYGKGNGNGKGKGWWWWKKGKGYGKGNGYRKGDDDD